MSPEFLHNPQESVLFCGLKTSDVKLLDIEEAEKLIEERIRKLEAVEKNYK